MELKKQKKIKIKKQTVMRRIRDLGQKKTEGNNANWKLEKNWNIKKPEWSVASYSEWVSNCCPLFSMCFCQDSNGVTCPFCRCEIRSTEQIIVDPFHKTQEDTLTKYSSTDDDDSGNFEVFSDLLLYCPR